MILYEFDDEEFEYEEDSVDVEIALRNVLIKEKKQRLIYYILDFNNVIDLLEYFEVEDKNKLVEKLNQHTTIELTDLLIDNLDCFDPLCETYADEIKDALEGKARAEFYDCSGESDSDYYNYRFGDLLK